MQVHCSEGLATHTGPESCAVVREDRREALTGVRTGWVLNREIPVTPECRLCPAMRKATPAASLSRDANGLRAVYDPMHVRKHLYGNREIPRLTRCVVGSAA